MGRGPWVELSVDGPDIDLCSAIARIPAVEQVERLEARRYRIRGGAAVEPELARAATAGGWELRTLIRHSASLEAVFLALVGEER